MTKALAVSDILDRFLVFINRNQLFLNKTETMTAKYGTKILTELLNFDSLKVNSYRQHEGIGIILQVDSLNKESTCPRCGKKSHRLHQNHRYLVKDLPLSGQAVYLEVNRRQFKCNSCQKPFSEELNFLKPRRTYTKRLAHSIIQEVLENDIHSVAKKSHVTTEEIETMLKDMAQELLESKPTELKRLGIDEIALIKGQGKYCAVLIDLDKSKLVAIIEARTQEKIKETLTAWGWEVLEQIKEVSIDLWLPYKSLIEELMPDAQVVADRFHVMKQVNKELDTQRKQQNREAMRQKEQPKFAEILDGLTKSKYALLKNELNLNEQQKIKLEQVKLVAPVLGKMHELKEELRKVFERSNHWLSGLFNLGSWLVSATDYFPESCQTIRRWLDEIIAYFDNRTTNGVVEGINNKLKLIKRSGYGFKNFENFRIRCLLQWHFNC